jgi:GTP-binding protein
VRQDIQSRWGDRVSIQLFSSPKRIGIEDAQAVLAEWMQLGEFALPDSEETEG